MNVFFSNYIVSLRFASQEFIDLDMISSKFQIDFM